MENRGYRKTRTGVVVSDKMDKTVVVAIKTKVRHPLYGKMVNRTRKFKAHDEENASASGIPCASWRPGPSARISAGGWPRSSKRPSKPERRPI